MSRSLTLFCAAALCAGLWSDAQAEGPKPFPQFSAKRVKPPSAGTAKRITVQIAPTASKPTAPAGPAAQDAPVVTEARYNWFWETVSTKRGPASPARLEPALVRLMNPPQGQGVAAPRLQDIQDIATRYGRDIMAATIGTRVSPALALAVISVESGGRPAAVSGAGAQGLMQLMPATAERFGVTDSFDASQNIAGGVRFLDFLMDKFAGDPILVLAGYNAGENSVDTHDGVPPYPETRDYVPKVLAAFSVAKGLCLTAPELASDGCVLRMPSN